MGKVYDEPEVIHYQCQECKEVVGAKLESHLERRDYLRCPKCQGWTYVLLMTVEEYEDRYA